MVIILKIGAAPPTCVKYSYSTCKGLDILSFITYVKPILIYLFITLIPSLAISFLLTNHLVEDTHHQYMNRAKWYANFHGMNIDNFLSETVGRLEMLASSIKIQQNSLNDVEEILQETQKGDSRFSGFYWANPKGDLLISTNPSSSEVNVWDRQYFQETLKTKKTSFSEAHFGRVTGRFIVTIATPIEENGEIFGVLLASLRLDEIEENMKSLLKDESIMVTGPSGQEIIKSGSLRDKNYMIHSSVYIPQVSWKITAFVLPDNLHFYRNSFFLFFVSIFIIMNILFLLGKYLRLQKRIKYEKEQNELQKLELIGNLAASTAHEIRNPLTGIKGLITLLREDSCDQKSRFYYDVILKELNRINEIVSELLVLGKPTAHKLEIYDANQILKEIEPIIQSEANYRNVHLSIQLSSEELPISCVKDHLKQVVLNLSKNALHAMTDGGKLDISLEKQLDTCILKVEDTGIGIPQELLDKIFDPFFTMKKEGSGLGLTVCKRIIDTYGGKISVQSIPEKGTKVNITLPLTIK